GDKVDVRPLREMTGRALFNEVFLNDARVPDANIVGGKNSGWAVANTTLMFERAGLGAGGHGATSTANAGPIAGDLEQRAGAFARFHAADAADRKELEHAIDQPLLGMITETALFAQGPPIYGGTDQVQRNIIGERVLGLPKEPNNDKTMSYRELPKNG